MLKINLGCGPHAIAGWTNYDIDAHPGVIARDLRQPLPHDDNSVDFIFTEHFLEHIKRHEALALIREAHRILKPGGVLRVTIPDLEMVVDDYQDNNLTRVDCWKPATRCQMINEAFHEWGHQFLYDKDELAQLLREAGFGVIASSAHGYSVHPELVGREVRPNCCELVFEATK